MLVALTLITYPLLLILLRNPYVVNDVSEKVSDEGKEILEKVSDISKKGKKGKGRKQNRQTNTNIY